MLVGEWLLTVLSTETHSEAFCRYRYLKWWPGALEERLDNEPGWLTR